MNNDIITELIKLHNQKAVHQQDLLQDARGICRCIPAGTHGSTPHLLKTVILMGNGNKKAYRRTEKIKSMYNTETIRVNELFSGIGAFHKALERLDIPHEIVGISEIDKYAIKSYEAIYGATRNYGDISKVDKLDYADLWTYGFPCQDISVAGMQQGIIRGETRSGLLYEVQRLLAMSAVYGELPKYLILENVKNLVGKKFKPDFDSWLEWLDDLGYNNYRQVINAKDCGIPQNRERVFVVSIRKDIDEGFSFPPKIPLTTTMADFLEDEVDEKFYISDTYIKYVAIALDEQNKRIRTDDTVGMIMTDGSSPKHNNRVIQPDYRIRKLTPKECWRLMGFDDADFDKAEKVCSNTQLYKQAGNSIVVDVLEGILGALLLAN